MTKDSEKKRIAICKKCMERIPDDWLWSPAHKEYFMTAGQVKEICVELENGKEWKNPCHVLFQRLSLNGKISSSEFFSNRELCDNCRYKMEHEILGQEEC